MESMSQISVLAMQFDDLCKGFTNLIEGNILFQIKSLIVVMHNLFNLQIFENMQLIKKTVGKSGLRLKEK